MQWTLHSKHFEFAMHCTCRTSAMIVQYFVDVFFEIEIIMFVFIDFAESSQRIEFRQIYGLVWTNKKKTNHIIWTHHWVSWFRQIVMFVAWSWKNIAPTFRNDHFSVHSLTATFRPICLGNAICHLNVFFVFSRSFSFSH